MQKEAPRCSAVQRQRHSGTGVRRKPSHSNSVQRQPQNSHRLVFVSAGKAAGSHEENIDEYCISATFDRFGKLLAGDKVGAGREDDLFLTLKEPPSPSLLSISWQEETCVRGRSPRKVVLSLPFSSHLTSFLPLPQLLLLIVSRKKKHQNQAVQVWPLV